MLTQAYAAPPGPYSFDRRDPVPRDVQIEILFCGVCHSDLHAARSEWEGPSTRSLPGTRSSAGWSRLAEVSCSEAQDRLDLLQDRMAACLAPPSNLP